MFKTMKYLDRNELNIIISEILCWKTYARQIKQFVTKKDMCHWKWFDIWRWNIIFLVQCTAVYGKHCFTRKYV